MDFPRRLRKVIGKSGLKLNEFYERLGVSKSQFFNYLGGRSEPTLSFFQRLKLEFPWVDLEWLTVGSAGSYTVSDGEIPIVSSPLHRMGSPEVAKIEGMLPTLGDDDLKDVLKYTEERILLAGLKRKAG